MYTKTISVFLVWKTWVLPFFWLKKTWVLPSLKCSSMKLHYILMCWVSLLTCNYAPSLFFHCINTVDLRLITLGVRKESIASNKFQ